MPTKSSTNSAHSFEKIEIHFQDGTSFVQFEQPHHAMWSDSVTFGDNVPNWKENLRDGIAATTSMVGTRHTLRVVPGRHKSTRKTPFGAVKAVELTGLMGCFLTNPYGDIGSISDTDANNLALGKFAQRITEVGQAIQGGVVLGELRQTLQTIKNPARGLRRLVDDWGYTARRIRGLRVYPLAFRKKKVLENLADAWLEVQFGWKPLLNDIENGVLALHKYNAGQSLHTRRLTASHEVSTTLSDNRSDHEALGALWTTYVRSKNHAKVIYRGAMRVEPFDPQTLNARSLGFNPGSFAPTAWELMPYSFLIDYFSNIGGIIYGFSTLTTRLAWCNRTVRTRNEIKMWTAQDANYNANLDITVVHTPAKVVSETVRVSRAAYSGLFIPGVAFKIPKWDSLKWLNIAALVASRRSDRNWSFD